MEIKRHHINPELLENVRKIEDVADKINQDYIKKFA
jgi:hypothetical protein